MNRIITILTIASIAFVVSSCNKSLDKTLFGTWTVTKVEGTYNANGASIFTAEDTNPTGFVRFDNNGRGEQDYSFTFTGTVYTQQSDFSWEANEDEIIINRVSDPDMIWTRVVDSDNMQVASYNIVVNANENWDYTLTLQK